MAEIKYEVVEKIGVLSDVRGNRKELRKIAWNGRDAKYDIRTWYDDEDGNEKMGKGITLSDKELDELYTLINKIKQN